MYIQISVYESIQICTYDIVKKQGFTYKLMCTNSYVYKFVHKKCIKI